MNESVSGAPVSDLRPAEQRLALVMRVFAALYFGFLTGLLVFEKQVIGLLNWQQSLLGIGRPMDLPNEPFWKFVAASLVFSYGLISLWASQDIRNRRFLVRLQVWGKLFSTALFFAWFAGHDWPFPYFLGGLSDLAMGVVAGVFLVAAYPDERDLLRRPSRMV